MRQLAKSTATPTQAELEAQDKAKGEELAKSVDEVMKGLDDFIKSSTAGAELKAKEVAKVQAEKKEETDAATLAKSLQADEDKKAEEALEFSKAIEVPAQEAQELDGHAAFNALRADMRTIVSKGLIAIQRNIMAHVDEKIGQLVENQVLVAKALSVNGKLLTEAVHEMVEIGGQPKPRKAALSVFEKSLSGGGGAAEEAEPKLDVQTVMTKALALNAQQKITPTDVNIINHHVVAGMGIPPRYKQLFETTN